jgi:protein Hikeshi
MEVDFSLQPNVLPQQPPFGLIVPGSPVRTDFSAMDSSNKFALRLHCPGDINVPLATVTEIVFFTLPNIPIPAGHGVLCYWQIASSEATSHITLSTGFELLGAITPDRPSSIFPTGWSENEELMEVSSAGIPVVVTIGASLEPLDNIQNLGSHRTTSSTPTSQSRLFVAQKIASDLFHFMQSFDTGAAGSGYMSVPNNIFDRWFQRFENRFRRDPNFFLKSDE